MMVWCCPATQLAEKTDSGKILNLHTSIAVQPPISFSYGHESLLKGQGGDDQMDMDPTSTLSPLQVGFVYAWMISVSYSMIQPILFHFSPYYIKL